MSTYPEEKAPLLPPDNEKLPLPVSQQKEPEDKKDDTPTGPSGRQMLFLFSMLWLSWIVAVFADVLIQGARMLNEGIPRWQWSGIQRWFLFGQWDIWIYDKFPFLWTKHMLDVSVGALTLCALLLMAISNAQQALDTYHHAVDPSQLAHRGLDTFASAIAMTLGMLLARHFHANVGETDIYFLAGGWLINASVLEVGRRMRLGNLGEMVGIEKGGKVENWLCWAAVAVMVGTHVWIWRADHGFFAVVVLWQGVKFVTRWLG